MASEDLIHLLPDSVANQIAAGEVIQRPASVVKELVENSVDAGATSIQVRLTDAGRTNIQVIDNGKGMSETDARMAFERYATSKISTPSDLFALHTFGFRGEALASIAAVAQVELRTRREEDDLGTVIHLAGSRLESQEAAMCPVGTNFQVKNLFFNVPARRKFLKSDQTEMNNVLAEIERVALVHPEIAFAVYRNDVELTNVPQTTLRQRIQHLFGKKLGQELLSVEVDTTLVKVTGCVGIPESARKKGAHCFFFVNGRYMRHPYFHKAVMEAYAHLIPSTEQVPYFLYFTVDPSRIDVNIHPTKTEIKFEDEQAIWQILMASVREVLGRSNAAPSIDFDVADCPDIPVYTSDKTPLPPSPSADTTYNPFKQGGAPGYKRTPLKWEDLYGEPKASMPEFDEPNTPAISQDNLLWESDAPQRREAVETEGLGRETQLFDSETSMQESCAECYQYKGRYIVTSMKSGLMLVDQHRAHVRILFERYMAQMGGRPGVCQGMLFPETVNVPMAQVAYMDQLLEDFSRLGFDINSLGGGTYAIQGVPEGVAGLKPSDLVLDMLSGALERGSVSKDDIHYGLALTMARASALVVGEVLAPSEMAHLIDDLFACEMPGYTPEGKRVFIIIDDGDIDARFR